MTTPLIRATAVLGLALLATPAFAQEDDDPARPEGTQAPDQRGPDIRSAEAKFKLDGEYTIEALIALMASSYRMNFILEDPKLLQEKVRIISHESVGRDEAYQAIVAALEAKGFTVVKTGTTNRIIKTSEASQNPIATGEGDRIAYTAAFVTQIMPLKNVSVSDVNSVVTSLASANAKVIAYAPSNTLIITDSAHNIRRIQRILGELDIAAPKSEMQIIPIQYADAEEVKSIIEQLYSVGESSSSANNNQPAQTAAQRRRAARARARRRRNAPEPAPETSSVTAGEQSNYISKILSDTRTNSLIVLANEEGMAAVIDIVAKLDVDVDPNRRSQIHVVYLQHAKAEDVASVLANLSESGGGTQQRNTRGQTAAQRAAALRAGQQPASEEEGNTSVTAAFDSGMRITHDENTNSLVIIAAEEDFRVVKKVIDQLDVRRRQVFVDAVILEIGSNDELEVGLGVHAPVQAGPDAVGIVASSTPLQSAFGLSQDLLSGLALGVFGDGVEVPVVDPTSGQSVDLTIPAFGIVMNALKSNSAINIVSNPTLVTLDNEEARIEVGRKIPFPTTSGLNNLGQPVVSYQREDVALKLEVLPRINSANEVTLEITVEVSEIEEDNRGLDVNTAGFITSKREVETVTLVADNETVVLGGLVGMTDTTVETKVPILGDLPLIGALFRGSRNESRKSDLMIFLTPHIIDGPEDMLLVRQVKEAQRQEFIRRFYGKSREEQMAEIRELLGYSMNYLDEPSKYPPRQTPEDMLLEEEDEGPVPDDAVIIPDPIVPDEDLPEEEGALDNEGNPIGEPIEDEEELAIPVDDEGGE